VAGLPVEYKGVTFENVQYALASLYFFKLNMTDEEFSAKLKYVVPMQHNFENPINAESNDTFIEYWIDDDDRLSQDKIEGDQEIADKTATISLRFLGAQAEQWAKAMHHLTWRKTVRDIFAFYCQATMEGCFEYVGKIVPQNVDYFGTGNSTIAFDVTFSLRYNESITLSREALTYLSLSSGELIGGNAAGGE
jgi:hypothetical protein